MKWLVWTHDPCPEGGWHIMGEFDTQEEAIEKAKAHHEREMEFNKGMHADMPDYIGCYDACMVTPEAVFRLDVPQV